MVPSQGRGWDANSRSWSLDPDYAEDIGWIIEQHFGIKVQWPKALPFRKNIVTNDFKLHYVGNTKGDWDTDKRAASGLGFASDKDWAYIFWESALKDWFSNPHPEKKVQRATSLNYYQVLKVPENVAFDDLKAYWRKALIASHPDHHPESEKDKWTELSFQINEAYDILRDPLYRKRYDIGLQLEREEQAQATRDKQSKDGMWGARHGRNWDSHVFSPPERCGFLKTQGYYRLGHFFVTKILDWDPITDRAGRTLVTSFDSRDRQNMHVVDQWI